MISKFSVKKPYTIFVAVILIIVLGIISFTSMTTDLLPNMNLPYAVVITTYPGASPEKIETMVTKPLEQTLSSVSNIKKISSNSSENSSMLMLEFSDGVNMDSAIIEINSKIDLIEGAWDDAISKPMIIKLNPNMMPIMTTAVDIEGLDNAEISKFVDEKLLPELEKVDGVGSVSTMGVIEEKIEVKLNQEKIDKVNEEILKNLDKSLSETGKKLNNAKSQINKGKLELNNQAKIQEEKIQEGITAISDGKSKIQLAQNDIEQKEITLKVNKANLEYELIGIDNTYLKLQTEKERLINLGSSITVGEQERLNEIEKSLEDMYKTKLGIQQNLIEVELGLKNIASGEQELVVQKTSLEKQEEQLKDAKATMNIEINKAKTELDSSEAKVKDGISEFDNAREEAYKKASLDGIITQTMISGILTAENFAMPAGYLKTEDDKIIVKVGDAFNSIDEMKNLTLFSFDIDGLENVTLNDVADTQFANNSDEIYSKINQNDGIILTFQKQSIISTAEVSDKLAEKMTELEEKYDNLRFTVLMDQGMYIDMIISSVLNNLVYGGILAIIILLLFLKDIKPTIIIALSIPISVTFAITLMYFTGVTINVISLSGLALGVGMLVDNSIVVIENIYRLKNKGMSSVEAAIKGAKSVSGAIFASTLTTVCVFLPIVFIEGISRQLFQDMGLTIAYSLLASLIIALTLVPAMSSRMFNNIKEKEHKWFDKIVKVYEKTLNIFLNKKWIVFIFTIGLLVLSGYLASKMGTAFMPDMESTQVSITVEMPKDIKYNELKDKSNEIINKLLTIEDIEVIGAIESGEANILGISGQTSNSVSMYAILKENKVKTNVEIEKEIYRLTEDLNCDISVSSSDMDMSFMGGSGVNVSIKGNDLDLLQNISKDITKIFEDTEGFLKVNSSIGNESIEKRIVVDKNNAMKYGITVAQVFSEISSEIKIENKATTLSIENKDYPVFVIKSDEDIIKEDNIMDIEIEGKEGEEQKNIKLSEIANIQDAESMETISHENSQRYVSITGLVDSDYNIGLVSREFEKKLNEYKAPEGYLVELSGENETINQTIIDLIKMIALAILFIYLIMVAQFQSLLSPFIVMFTIPLAFTGGLLALFITGSEISIIAMLGFLILAGIVVNNGIVFIDFIIQLRLEGIDRRKAIVQAGKTRIRPIMMTAMTTILGLSTVALGIGSGAEMTQSLGIVTIGGLIYSTILTLYVVPCIYDVLCKKDPRKIEKEKD